MSFESWTEDEIDKLHTGTGLRRPSPHQSIFKYVGLSTKTSWERLEETLNQHRLIGTTAKALNDPFELSPAIYDDLRPSIAEAVIKQSLRDRLTSTPIPAPDVITLREQALRYLDKVREHCRVVAFCERSDSPLLWSHYANSYRGACLHFLGRAFKTREKLKYVTYSNHRPVYPLSLALRLSTANDIHGDKHYRLVTESNRIIFYSKAADWSYETEIRAVYNTSSERGALFEPDGLVSIIVGPRMSGDDRSRLQKLVRASKIPNLEIRDANLSGNSFSVEIGSHPVR